VDGPSWRAPTTTNNAGFGGGSRVVEFLRLYDASWTAPSARCQSPRAAYPPWSQGGLQRALPAPIVQSLQPGTLNLTATRSGVVWNLSFKSFLIIFFGLAVLGAAGAIVSLVYAMHRAVS
jgi:hypothetical protein